MCAGMYEIKNKRYISSFPDADSKEHSSKTTKMNLKLMIVLSSMMQISNDKFTSKDENPAPPRVPMLRL